MTDPLGKAIDDLIPKSLDDIIRKNREECTFRLAVDADFASLVPMVTSITDQKPIRGTIDEWRVICAHGKDTVLLFLTGMLRE
jgi:hypothetical protein